MTSVRGGRAMAEGTPAVADPDVGMGCIAPAPAMSAAMETQRERTLQAAVDSLRFPLTRLVRSVAERLLTRPMQIGLGTLEVEVRDTLLAMGCDLLSDVVRLRGTGYRGHSYV
ncbi:MAG: hypothetical protein ACRDI2_21515, partial [Chloroflexota bacterium]